MHLSYEKLGKDHPMFGKADYIVMDHMQPVCYKTKNGYLPIESDASKVQTATSQTAEVASKPFYVLSFKVNGEPEEMSFKSKKKLDKTIAFYATKDYVTDVTTQVYQILD